MITFKNWIMSVHRLKSGSTGKYQHSVSGVPSGCALGNSLELMLVFPCAPLLSSMYRLSTVQSPDRQPPVCCQCPFNHPCPRHVLTGGGGHPPALSDQSLPKPTIHVCHQPPSPPLRTSQKIRFVSSPALLPHFIRPSLKGGVCMSAGQKTLMMIMMSVQIV